MRRSLPTQTSPLASAVVAHDNIGISVPRWQTYVQRGRRQLNVIAVGTLVAISAALTVNMFLSVPITLTVMELLVATAGLSAMGVP